MEEWKQHSDLPANYMISTCGRVYNSKTNYFSYGYVKKGCKPYYCLDICSQGKKKTHKIHRLMSIFLGQPDSEQDCIDHIDGNSLNNNINNLRWCTLQQNCFNSQRWKNKTLPKGVGINGNRYRSRIRYNGKLINIGYFKTIDEASQAYQNKASELFGEYAFVDT